MQIWMQEIKTRERYLSFPVILIIHSKDISRICECSRNKSHDFAHSAELNDMNSVKTPYFRFHRFLSVRLMLNEKYGLLEWIFAIWRIYHVNQACIFSNCDFFHQYTQTYQVIRSILVLLKYAWGLATRDPAYFRRWGREMVENEHPTEISWLFTSFKFSMAESQEKWNLNIKNSRFMCGIDEGVWERKHNRKKRKSVGRKFSTNFLRNFRTYTFGCSLNSKYPDYGIAVCTILFALPSFRLHLFAISSLMLCVCCAMYVCIQSECFPSDNNTEMWNLFAALAKMYKWRAKKNGKKR